MAIGSLVVGLLTSFVVLVLGDAHLGLSLVVSLLELFLLLIGGFLLLLLHLFSLLLLVAGVVTLLGLVVVSVGAVRRVLVLGATLVCARAGRRTRGQTGSTVLVRVVLVGVMGTGKALGGETGRSRGRTVTSLLVSWDGTEGVVELGSLSSHVDTREALCTWVQLGPGRDVTLVHWWDGPSGGLVVLLLLVVEV